MPLKFRRELETRILDVKDAAVSRLRGAAGGMQKKRTQEECIARRHRANNLGAFRAQFLNAV